MVILFSQQSEAKWHQNVQYLETFFRRLSRQASRRGFSWPPCRLISCICILPWDGSWKPPQPASALASAGD